MSDKRLKNQLEGLLFISPKPLGIGELAKLVAGDRPEIEKLLDELIAEYASRGGLQLLKLADKYLLVAS